MSNELGIVPISSDIQPFIFRSSVRSIFRFFTDMPNRISVFSIVLIKYTAAPPHSAPCHSDSIRNNLNCVRVRIQFERGDCLRMRIQFEKGNYLRTAETIVERLFH